MSWAEAKKITMDVADIINANCKIIGSTTDIMKALTFTKTSKIRTTRDDPLKVSKNGTVLFHLEILNASSESANNKRISFKIYEIGDTSDELVKSVTEEVSRNYVTPKISEISINVTANKQYYITWQMSSSTVSDIGITVRGDIRGKVVNFAFYE